MIQLIKVLFNSIYVVLSGIFLAVIQFTHGFTGNYGVDIILLTALIRVAMYPLTLTSIKSMKTMQELQPKIKELKKKYGDDKERLNKETLDLYRKHGANPLSGCLPLLLQLPIFIVLFQMLRLPERNGYIFINASFCGIDLTTAAFNRISADFLGNLPLVLPGMVDLSFLGISFFNNSYLYLPTLALVAFMTVTTFLTQKGMTMDQSQSANFMFMNIFIVFISFTMPSGVLLYWGMSNFFQLVQQKLVPQPSAAKDVKKEAEEGVRKAPTPSPDTAKEEKAGKTKQKHIKTGAKKKKKSRKRKKKRKKRK